MTMHKPLLDIPFMHRPQEAQPRELLELENSQCVVHRYVPDASLREHRLRKDLRNSVESESDDPVKHLHQEGEFLHYPTMEVVRKSGGIRCVECRSTASSLLRCILHHGQGLYALVIATFVGQHLLSCQKIVGRACGVWLLIQKTLLPSPPVQNTEAASPVEYHRSN